MRFHFFLFLSSFLWLSLTPPQPAFAGKPQSQLTLVEYYDYACPHCRRMAKAIARLQTQCPKLHIVYRVVPLLTPTSGVIARFALAAQKQGRGVAIHAALMALTHVPTLKDMQQLIARFNLNSQKLRQTMQQHAIRARIQANIQAVKPLAKNGVIRLPLLVFRFKTQSITLVGEQPYALLRAVVKQLRENAHVDPVASSTT